MMYPMHVRCNHEESKHPVYSWWYIDVAVVKHGGDIEDDLGQQQEEHREG